MTQEDIANAVHVARNTVSNWEHGRTQPDLDTMRQLSQLLQYDFLNGEAKPQDASVAEAPSSFAEPSIQQTPTAKPAAKNRGLLIGGAVLAVLIISLIFLFVLRNKPVTEVRDEQGNLYRISDFQQVAVNEAGKAYITIDTATETMQGENMVYWMYTFTLREDNGIDFHIDRLENVWIKKSDAHAFIFVGDADLANAELGPDIPARQKVTLEGGFPKNQPNMVGVGLRIYGHDANGADLTFTGYIPYPQD